MDGKEKEGSKRGPGGGKALHGGGGDEREVRTRLARLRVRACVLCVTVAVKGIRASMSLFCVVFSLVGACLRVRVEFSRFSRLIPDGRRSPFSASAAGARHPFPFPGCAERKPWPSVPPRLIDRGRALSHERPAWSMLARVHGIARTNRPLKSETAQLKRDERIGCLIHSQF